MDVLNFPLKLDGSHRALTRKVPGGKPMMVIARVHSNRVKEGIIQDAQKRRGKLFYRENPVTIFEDYCLKIVEQRTAYREVMSALYQLGFKPSLKYPAKFRITTKDGTGKLFASVKEAKMYCVVKLLPIPTGNSSKYQHPKLKSQELK